MPPILHLLRHGQGLHNLKADYTIPDPPLTDLGTQQCLTLQSQRFSSPTSPPISLILASPMLRALQSARTIFSPHLSSPTPNSPDRIIALPSAQETSSDACDIGRSPSELKASVQENDWPVDLSLVHEGWNDKSFSSPYGPSGIAIAARAKWTRRWIRAKVREIVEKEGREDVHVALVSHGGFCHYFTGDWEDAAFNPGTGWMNCEGRSFCFEDGLGLEEREDDARVVETKGSREARGKVGGAPSREEQALFYEVAMQAWEAQGLERPDRIPFQGDVEALERAFGDAGQIGETGRVTNELTRQQQLDTSTDEKARVLMLEAEIKKLKSRLLIMPRGTLSDHLDGREEMLYAAVKDLEKTFGVRVAEQ